MWCYPKSTRLADLPPWDKQPPNPREYLNYLRRFARLEMLANHLIEKKGYTRRMLKSALPEYRRFLALAAVHKGTPFPVGGVIDIIWHEHLLFTESYQQMCAKCTGGMIHHRPEILDRGTDIEPLSEKAFTVLFRSAFNRKPLMHLWR